MSTTPQRPMSLALTPPLHRWLGADPLWRRQPAGWRLAQRWRALWGGINLRLSEASTRQSAAALQDPVLILGPWRSGTTVMHELLSAATGLATPLTWHCMDAPAFRLARVAPADASIARPMDGLAIGAHSPQEDEFALLAMGVDSAYRAFLMPHRIEQLHHTLDPDFWLHQQDWLAPWELFLRGVLQAPGAAGTQPLILKSPNHSFRLPAIVQRFPRSRVVWMLRDPAAVLESNRKMWRAMFAAHGISAESAGSLDQFLAAALHCSADMLDWCVTQLPADCWTLCSQDALRADAAREVERVASELGLQARTSSPAFAAAVERTARGRVERYAPASEAATLARAIAALDAAQQRALDHMLKLDRSPAGMR